MQRLTTLRAMLLGAICTPVSFCVLAQPAQSPAPASGGAAAPSDQLEEIVVTASKRTETAQKSPIALRVVSGEALRESNVSDVQGLTRLAPDLGITTDTIYTKLSLRGVTAETIEEGADAALTVNIDGEYINRPSALNASFFDLERIEVLKGPQGTLYGRNATAGAINIIPKKPTDEFEGYLTADFGNYSSRDVQGALNIPIVDGLAIRIAGFHNEHDGYRDNEPVGHGDDGNQSGVRATVKYQNEGLTAVGGFEYINIDQTAVAQFGIPINPGSAGLVTLSGKDISGNIITDQVPIGNLGVSVPRQDYALDNLGNFKSQQLHFRARVDYDFDNGFDAAYVGGFYRNRSPSYLPLSGTPDSLQFYSSDPHQDSDDYSNEFHVDYKDDSGLFVQAGGFYFHEKQDVQVSIQITPSPFGPPGTTTVYVNDFFRPDIELDSYSGFGQADIPVLDTLKLSVGFRYTHDEKSAVYYNAGLGFIDPAFGLKLPTIASLVSAAGGVPTICGTGRSGGIAEIIDQCYSDNKMNWLTGLEWTPEEGHLLYFKVSTAFRSGGFDNLTQQTLNGVAVGNFAPEEITAYELGSKNRFLDNRLEFNAAAFHYDYSNLQVDSFLNTTVGHYTANAGQGSYNGVETDLVFDVTPHDTIHSSANWLDARYDVFNTVETGINGNAVPVNLAGNHPPQAPKWTLALDYQHEFDLGSTGSLTFDAYSRYKSAYYLTSYNRVGDRQEGYSQTDLSLTYRPEDRQYSLQLYVHNLENYMPYNFSSYTAGPPINLYNYAFGAPQTYGVQANIEF